MGRSITACVHTCSRLSKTVISLVAEWLGTILQTGRSRVRDLMNEFFSIYLILQGALGPGVHSASIGNEYQQKNKFLGSRARPVRRADNLTGISQSIV
jgi:hypothetical protein